MHGGPVLNPRSGWYPGRHRRLLSWRRASLTDSRRVGKVARSVASGAPATSVMPAGACGDGWGRSHAHECHLARCGRCGDHHRKRASGLRHVHTHDWLTRLLGEDLETAAKRVLHRHARERGTGSIARVYVYTWLLLPLRGIETGYDQSTGCLLTRRTTSPSYSKIKRTACWLLSFSAIFG